MKTVFVEIILLDINLWISATSCKCKNLKNDLHGESMKMDTETLGIDQNRNQLVQVTIYILDEHES